MWHVTSLTYTHTRSQLRGDESGRVKGHPAKWLSNKKLLCPQKPSRKTVCLLYTAEVPSLSASVVLAGKTTWQREIITWKASRYDAHIVLPLWRSAKILHGWKAMRKDTAWSVYVLHPTTWRHRYSASQGLPLLRDLGTLACPGPGEYHTDSKDWEAKLRDCSHRITITITISIYSSQSKVKDSLWYTGLEKPRLAIKGKNHCTREAANNSGPFCSTSLNCYLQVPGHPWPLSRAYGPLPTTPAWWWPRACGERKTQIWTQCHRQRDLDEGEASTKTHTLEWGVSGISTMKTDTHGALQSCLPVSGSKAFP